MKGDNLATCSVATTERWLDKTSEEWKSKTEWHNLKAWRYSAEKMMRAAKGWTVYVEGKITTNEWTDKEGNERKTTEIDVQDFKVISKPQGQEMTAEERELADEENAHGRFNDSDNSLPF